MLFKKGELLVYSQLWWICHLLTRAPARYFCQAPLGQNLSRKAADFGSSVCLNIGVSNYVLFHSWIHWLFSPVILERGLLVCRGISFPSYYPYLGVIPLLGLEDPLSGTDGCITQKSLLILGRPQNLVVVGLLILKYFSCSFDRSLTK